MAKKKYKITQKTPLYFPLLQTHYHSLPYPKTKENEKNLPVHYENIKGAAFTKSLGFFNQIT